MKFFKYSDTNFIEPTKEEIEFIERERLKDIETLKTIAKLGKYGIVVINENNSNK